MERLRIRLLGGLEITRSSDAGTPVLSRKVKALVAYLALQHGQPQSREKLAALFWPESPEEQARTNLRQALAALRKRLGDILLTEGDQVTLDGSVLDVDTVRFEECVSADNLTGLEQAAALYKGDLLEGFSIKEDAFEAWLLPVREHYRGRMIDGLIKMVDCYEESRNIAELLEASRRLLALDPLNEEAHRSLMRAYAAQGRHGTALKQFEACRENLKRDLGVEPEPKTVALYQNIRKRRGLTPKDNPNTAKKLEAEGPPLPNGPSLATEHPIRFVPVSKQLLGWPMLATGLAVIVVVVATALWQRPWEPREEPAAVANMAFPLPDKPSIAVLPFHNLTADPDQEYFADGMTDDLITDLSKLSGLFVIARNSSFSYKGRQVKVRQVAEELGVRYVLEGSVRRAGGEVRINAQLIDATTGGHLWADRYDGTLEGVFDLQDRVTEQIVEALAVSLTEEEQAERSRHATENVSAHDAYLQGWARYKLQTPEALAEAIPFFEEAIRLDSEYSQAHAALASVYWDAYRNDWAFDLDMPSTRAESRANEHLEKALTSPTPLAHALQADMLAAWGFYDNAVLEAEKAITLDENDATALAGLANALIQANQPAEGLDHIEQAMRLDPHHPPSYLIILGAAHFGMQSFEDAVATFERAVNRNPDSEVPLIYLASAYGHLGRIEDADNAINKANDLRNLVGLAELSLRETQAWAYDDSYPTDIDFHRFGSTPVQNLLRAGLIDVPSLKWQYLITVHGALGPYNTRWEVEGATQIDLPRAKSLYERGAIFIDVSGWPMWNTCHVAGAVHLSWERTDVPRYSKSALQKVAGYDDEIVLYYDDGSTIGSAFVEAAKAVVWGYQQVYHFDGGAKAWKEAGYPVETGE